MLDQQKRGFFPLSAIVMRVAGGKAAVFLHGQFSNHINGLKIGEANYNLLLTNKGKVVADLYAYRHAQEEFWLVINNRFSQMVLENLAKLAPLSRVTLTDETKKYFPIHLIDTSPIALPDTISFRTDRLGLAGYDCLVPSEKQTEMEKFLQDQKIPPIDSEQQKLIRVEQGISEVGLDATEENLPQEARLDRALHFDKGCYLGQEIIARLHYRGHVNKILVGLAVGANRCVRPESKIYRDGKEVGQITSSVFSPKLNALLCLGYVPYAQKEPGTEFEVGEERMGGVIVDLPV